jgi:hypothetical protein
MNWEGSERKQLSSVLSQKLSEKILRPQNHSVKYAACWADIPNIYIAMVSGCLFYIVSSNM